MNDKLFGCSLGWFPKMNTDFKKPPLAPKPKLVSHLTFKLPSPLMSRPCSSARGPKPPIAPKPKVPHGPEEGDSSLLSNNAQEGYTNGDLLSSDEDLDQENEPEDSLSGGKGLEEEEPVEPQYDSYSLSSVVNKPENGYEEQREQEEERMQEKEEDWRLTDSVQTEEVDSLDTLGVSDAGFTIDSVDAVEIIDMYITDDIDAEGCYAGEALADTDGLSIISIEEEEAACYLCETGPGKENEEEEHQIQEEEAEEEAADTTADAVTESLSEEPIDLLVKDNIEEDLVTQEPSSFKEEDEGEVEESSPYPGSPPNVLQEDFGYDVIGPSEERAERYQPYSIIDEEPMTIQYSMEEGECQHSQHKAKQLFNTEEEAVDPSLEPYYISTEDIVDPEQRPAEDKCHGSAGSESTPEESSLVTTETMEPSEYAAIGDDDSLCEDMGQIECVSSEDYVEIGDDDDDDDDSENMTGSCQRRTPGVQMVEAFLNHSKNQPRFRLVSISVPADTDTSQASSFSDSKLLSPDDSDVFRDEVDLEGHIIPYLDETTDTEDNLSDEHVYEEAGLDSEGENFLPFDRKSIVTRSRSLSGKVPGYVPDTVHEEAGSEFHLQNYCKVELDRSGPALNSSPMLNSTRAKSSSKPHRFLLYPRSFSMEGRDLPLCVYKEGQGSPGERREDSLSLPCVMGSSGSFSQRSPLPSSGLSTPTSMVDIPPPFELAYITKKPITKSSPSLFVEGDSPDRQKKKKSSFKRFLMLKFRRKTESKLLVDVNVSSSRSSPESSHHGPARFLDLDRRSTGSSPQLKSRMVSKPHRSPDSPSTFLFYKDGKRKGGSVAFLNRSVARVESFEDRSRAPYTPLPLTKPRSISFPNTDTSDYENIPAQTLCSDYENIQIPSRRPVRPGTFAEFFDHTSRVLSSANDTDGYVDMSSFPGFESKAQSPEQEPESAYTEAYTVCSIAVGSPGGSGVEAGGGTVEEEDQERTSEEEEEGGADNTYDRRTDGRSRAFYIAKELVDTERLHVKALKLLQEDFREAVGAAVGDEGDPVLEEERLREILNELPDVYALHRRILTELENRIRQWEESQRIADVILSRKSEFVVFTTYIGHYDRSMSLLDESCRTSPAFSAIVRQYEQQSLAGDNVSLKHQLLQVIIRVAQYCMLLTDYLNNLSPDSKEYEDTQAALVIVSNVADQANDSLKHGENLLRLVNIEYSVRGQRDLLQPGRVFVKEGTLMKVSRKCRQPRHLFLMNDVLLYTYPQQDGKYRLKNSLPLTGMKVSKPIIENVQNALRIEVADISITLAASSCSEREDWFHTLSRTVSDHARGPGTFSSCSGEARERLCLSLGEKAPTLVPVSHVMMCMNCTSDFSLTLRRHHCHACGRIVCRSCSRNRYPLKYLKDRMAKVCDHCYSELKKRGGDVSGASCTDSPRSKHRSSRPLSAVFQNIHPPSLWRHRKGTASLSQVSLSEEGSMSGTLQRSKRSKRNWKRLWFQLKDKEKVASESLPLLGFTVKLPDRPGGEETTNVFELYHKKTLYYTFKAEDNHTAKRWVNAMEEATVL
ncbi:FYVE, RhoGEF and PH domain-containing protein 5 isoform X1 [Coregonus clupeaformis]|uniref:FYVE, RhoGEF and PH domain-containing protein 5 isoform X1 n=1 Tax=Coregonus clupeaformis TaxID=59861 RepID=UPI001E1C61A3|nr:FYVE, RhoGEF and PH domain-containing protein 5 isoform X1 [Coregonus clupeaformis]